MHSGPYPWVECCEVLPPPHKALTCQDKARLCWSVNICQHRTCLKAFRDFCLLLSRLSSEEGRQARDSSFLLAHAVTVGVVVCLHNQGNGAQFKASIISNAELEASHSFIMFLLLFLYIQPSAACSGHMCRLLGTSAVWGDRHRLPRDVLVFAGRRRRVVFVHSCLWRSCNCCMVSSSVNEVVMLISY